MIFNVTLFLEVDWSYWGFGFGVGNLAPVPDEPFYGAQLRVGPFLVGVEIR